MKIIIENTSKIVEITSEYLKHTGEVPARIWEGKTESGIPVICFITRIMVREGADIDHSEFKRELDEQRAPTAEAQAIPLRLIL